MIKAGIILVLQGNKYQRDYVICPGSHGLEGAGLELQPCVSDLRGLAALSGRAQALMVGGGSFPKGNCVQAEL